VRELLRLDQARVIHSIAAHVELCCPSRLVPGVFCRFWTNRLHPEGRERHRRREWLPLFWLQSGQISLPSPVGGRQDSPWRQNVLILQIEVDGVQALSRHFAAGSHLFRVRRIRPLLIFLRIGAESSAFCRLCQLVRVFGLGL
jgi:hypothetical protein